MKKDITYEINLLRAIYGNPEELRYIRNENKKYYITLCLSGFAVAAIVFIIFAMIEKTFSIKSFFTFAIAFSTPPIILAVSSYVWPVFDYNDLIWWSFAGFYVVYYMVHYFTQTASAYYVTVVICFILNWLINLGLKQEAVNGLRDKIILQGYNVTFSDHNVYVTKKE